MQTIAETEVDGEKKRNTKTEIPQARLWGQPGTGARCMAVVLSRALIHVFVSQLKTSCSRPPENATKQQQQQQTAPWGVLYYLLPACTWRMSFASVIERSCHRVLGWRLTIVVGTWATMTTVLPAALSGMSTARSPRTVSWMLITVKMGLDSCRHIP